MNSPFRRGWVGVVCVALQHQSNDDGDDHDDHDDSCAIIHIYLHFREGKGRARRETLVIQILLKSPDVFLFPVLPIIFCCCCGGVNSSCFGNRIVQGVWYLVSSTAVVQ